MSNVSANASYTKPLAAILMKLTMKQIDLQYSKNLKKLAIIFLIFIIQSCVVIYKDLSKSSPENIQINDLKTGIIVCIPQNEKPLITNMVNIEIFQDSSMIENSHLPWYSNTSFSLEEGEYIINTYVIYMNRKTWKTTNRITLLNNEIKSIKIKYPFLMTGKPKVTIQ